MIYKFLESLMVSKNVLNYNKFLKKKTNIKIYKNDGKCS